MDNKNEPPLPRRWAYLRFSIIEPLLAAPPPRRELRQALRELASRSWTHPVTGEPVCFAYSTLERWYYRARRKRQDPFAALLEKERRDRGQQRAWNDRLLAALFAQYRAHPSWSFQLHRDNLVALAHRESALGAVPSYASVRRLMSAHALLRQRRVRADLTAGERKAAERLAEREVRSFEADHVNGPLECLNRRWPESEPGVAGAGTVLHCSRYSNEPRAGLSLRMAPLRVAGAHCPVGLLSSQVLPACGPASRAHPSPVRLGGADRSLPYP